MESTKFIYEREISVSVNIAALMRNPKSQL